jgi:Beta-propeller repeat
VANLQCSAALPNALFCDAHKSKMKTNSGVEFGFALHAGAILPRALTVLVAMFSLAGAGTAGNCYGAAMSPPPAVIASTYLGGPGFDIAWACAADGAGNVYIAGDTQEAEFPVTDHALQRSYGDGGQDGFVAKYDSNGKLLWSTFLGGSGWDGVFGLAVDAAGNAVVTGVTESMDFPVTANAVQRTLPGGDAAFVTVISADGAEVIYSTYLGGSQSDGVPVPINPFHALPPSNVETIGVGVTVGVDGTLYVVGGTNAIDLPVTSGAAQPLIGGESDGFMARIRTDAAGTTGLIYLTYIGGVSGDFCSAVTVDSAGNAFVTGEAQSLVFPTTLGAFQRVHTPGTVGFITKLNPSGTSFIYSTLLSGSQGSSASAGSNYTAPSAIAIDPDGHAYVAGETNDTDFPTTPGVVQPANAGVDDGFVTELSADGSSLVFSTYLGASDYEGLFGLKLDQSGNIFVDGYTSSRNLPLVQPFQSQFGGFIDTWVAELSPGGTTLLFSSYLGGSDQESAYAIDLWNNQLYVVGRTASNDFPVTSSAPQTTYGGGVWDNFLTIINLKPVQLVSAASRKMHGSVGPFDVDLPLAGPRGIECRSGGANGEYTLVFRFANPLTNVDGASVTSGTGSVSSNDIDISDRHSYIVNLTGVSNAQYITVNLTNLTDSTGNFSSAASISMGVLIGDVNASGVVTSGDTNLCKAQALQPVTQANFRNDINASGDITTGDVNIIKQNALTHL